MPTMTLTIAAGDDLIMVYHYYNGWGSNTTRPEFQLTGNDYGPPYFDRSSALLRFVGAELAALDGATITSAIIRLRPIAAHAALSPTQIDISGRLLDNAPQYDGLDDPDVAFTWSSPVSWTSTPAMSAGDVVDTPDITAVITELASGGYLASGVAMLYVDPVLPGADPDGSNSMYLRFSGWDGAYTVPQLIIEYELPSAVRVTVDRAASWAIAERVAVDRAASWDVTERVAVDRSALWDITERVTADRAASWHVSTAEGVPASLAAAVATARPVSATVATALPVSATVEES